MPARRILLVCPDGQINGIWYNGKTSANLLRGDMEFGFIYAYADGTCRGDQDLTGEIQQIGEMIIASLTVPLP